MMDSLRFVTVAGMMAAAVASYLIWGPKQRTRNGQIPGLLNLGNTCFLNAVLQALAACPSFFNWLSMVVARHSTFSHYHADNLSLCKALLETLQVLNNYQTCPAEDYEPYNILSALRQHHWIISPDEQDAHEMFLVLSSTIEEELGTTKDFNMCSFADVSLLEPLGNLHVYHACSKAMSPFLPFSPFKGLLTSRLMCKNCERRFPLKYDTFDSLSISIPPMCQNSVTLQTCLRYFVMSELVPNVDCENCAQNLRKDTRTTFLKQLSIGKLPKCLCIHIQRTVWLQNGMPMKRFEHVVYPEILNMEEFLYKNQKFHNVSSSCKNLVGGSGPSKEDPLESDSSQSSFTYLPSSETESDGASMSAIPKQKTVEKNIYRLQAVIVHLGDVFAGHFITYRRGALSGRNNNNWFFTSDLAVKSATLKEVLRHPAYVLFYERISGGSLGEVSAVKTSNH